VINIVLTLNALTSIVNIASTISLLALTLCVSAQMKDERKVADVTQVKRADLPDKSAQVDALLAPWAKDDSPGAAVMVIREGQILLSKGYGLANRETKEPFRPDTPSLIGSVSKQFTAMATMMLAEQGKLSYDDSLAKFFPEFPPYAQQITIRHLLNHTSGLPIFDEPSSPKHGMGKESTAEDMLGVLARQQKLRFAPGSKWEYNNSGYVLKRYMIHPGGWDGFKAFILRFPEQRFTVIALSNHGQFDIHNLPLAITKIYLAGEIAVPEKIVNSQ
jgi:CubicO group peptidase (beta-lactamase class C family)